MTGAKYFVLLLIVVVNCDAARILALFPVPSKSHVVLVSVLMKELALRGHEITMVSPYPLKQPPKNYRDIFLDNMDKFKEENMREIMKHNSTILEKVKSSQNVFIKMLDEVLSHKDVQELKKEKFDLIIQFGFMTEALLGFGHHFSCPVILFSTVGSNFYLNKIFGNPAPTSFVPSMMAQMALSSNLTFKNRLINTILGLVSHGFNYLIRSGQETIYTKHFPNSPPLDDLIQNISLVFLNSHFSIESPRPLVPNMIQVGGIHIEDPKPLPKELKEYLDHSTDGVILFSLGSNVRLLDLPEDKKNAILNTLGKLKQKVLFKSDETFVNASKNIRFSKWLPQSDVLAHPNVHLFISHGGLLSTTEAVYNGKPIIGIPIFGDQQSNVAVAKAHGYAVELLLDDLTEETFTKAIDEILNNKKYKETIQLKSTLLREQPMKPLDLAIFWVEHVLKHKGARHLKNGGSTLTWYQYNSLDVYLFIVSIIFIMSYISYIVTKKIVCAICNSCCRRKKIKTN